MRRARLRIVGVQVLVCLSLAGTLRAQAQVQTLPAGFDQVEGNSAVVGPLATVDAQKWHWVYDSANFLASAPILITAIEVRADGAAPPWSATTVASIEILAGAVRSDHAFGSYHPTFERNWRVTAPRLFFSGSWNLPAGGGGASPNPWSARLSGAPIYYDPRSGDDFALQIRTPAGGAVNPPAFALDASAGGAGQNGGNRIGHTCDPDAAAANRLDDELVPIVRIHYLPATGVFADFSASRRRGQIPLAVQFSDRSFSSAGPITSWAWDFESDGIVDSTARNPAHTYPARGRWLASLQVFDASGAMASISGAIESEDTPPPVPSFTPLPDTVAPLDPVTFIDFSSGNPDEYHWNFGAGGGQETCRPGDPTPPSSCGATPFNGVPGPSCSNPTRSYSTPGEFPVDLGVRRGGQPPCPPPLLTFTAYVCVLPSTENRMSAQHLEVPFDEARGAFACNTAAGVGAPERGRMSRSGWQGDAGRPLFQGSEPGSGCLAADPVNPAWLATGWPLDLCGSVTFSWWQRQRYPTGGVVADAWGAGPGAGLHCFTGGIAGAGLAFAGTRLGTYVSTLAVQGSMGVWKHCALVIDNFDGVARWYVDGAADPQVLHFPRGSYTRESQGADFQVGRHDGAALPLSAFFDLDDFRIYGHALTRAQILAEMGAPNPTTCRFDEACQGPAGAPRIGASDAPQLGNASFAIELDGAAPGSAGILLLGFSIGSLGGLQLPLDLSPFSPYFAGCSLNVVPDFVFPLTLSAAGTAAFPVPIPGEPLLAGAHAYAQILTLGATRGSATHGLDIALQR